MRPTNHFVNNEKKIYCIYEKFVNLVECNIFRNSHITQDVWPSNRCVIAYVTLRQKSLETPVLNQPYAGGTSPTLVVQPNAGLVVLTPPTIPRKYVYSLTY